MSTTDKQFRVMLCGKKPVMDRVRSFIAKAPEIHLQYTSSPNFLFGRALFNVPHVVIIDSSCEAGTLREVLQRIRSEFPGTSVFVIAAKANHLEAIDMMKSGASDYFAFPNDHRKLNDQLKSLLDAWAIAKSQQSFMRLQRKAFDFNQIVGRSSHLTDVLNRAKKVIENTALTVLITGETGTGKELLARAIHYNSGNGESPFVDIACSALPETLLESELFGYEKGAFTDAREKKVGLFELAGNGSLFLDEIGDISLGMQSKLLKVIESRTMRRLGGLHDIPVKARIIAATSADLEAKMKSGTFRADLYHRLKIIPLQMPPLRQRKEDIPLLAGSFIELFNRLYDKKILGITPEAMQLLVEQEWEGNIRELKHSLERAMLLEEDQWLKEEDFEFYRKLKPGHSNLPKNGKSNSSGASAQPIILSVPLDDASLDDVQRKLALKVLEYVRGNKSKAAYILRVSRPRLDRILKNSGN